ncbi:MAG TPA: kelch repeat-containing protein, partial [Polyangia bacterium]|nr:kelch repeat-containing protein [Polyangia bacterium]
MMLGAAGSGACRNNGSPGAGSDRQASALSVATATGAQVLAAARAQSGSPIQPDVAQGFNAVAGGLQPQFPAATSAAEVKPANLVLPQTASGAAHLVDTKSGAAVDVALSGGLPVPAQTVGGYVIYPAALAGGAAALHRALPGGTEDFVYFSAKPASAEVDYTVSFANGIAGLRLVGGVLEFVDAGGTPRLHVSPPYIVGSDGARTDGALAVSGCAVDTDPTPPWGRAVTAPGASTCTVQVTWPGAAVTYPAILDPKWSTTGSMATSRFEHTLTLLSTGRALAVGGRNSTSSTTGLASAELYDQTSGTWSATGSLAHGRRLHTATQLAPSSNSTTSGKILATGGVSATTSLNTAELYSPSAGTWIAAGTMDTVRHGHTATLLPDGRVLAAGGLNGTTTLQSASLFNPASGAGSWVATTGPLPPPGLKNHTATLIQTSNNQLNNHVLLVGGNNGTSTIAAVYLFDPVQNAFSTLASISAPREQHMAAALQNSNGKILIAGGLNGSTVQSSAIVFDPSVSNGSWSSAGTTTSPRVGATMTLLPNTIVDQGQVLVAGGSSTGSDTLSSAELFSNTTTWTATAAMPGGMKGQAALLLSGNMVLLAGGLSGSTVLSSAFLYDASFGLSCTSNSQCASGFCTNGVCCSSACTSGTCSACNVAGHLGTCSPRISGTVCRASSGSCDPAEACDGVSLACPSDSLTSAGTICRASTGACDPAETCSGSSASCPSDGLASAGTLCRAPAGPCDVAETCNGSSASCPSDGVAAAGTVCRAIAGTCDVAETCNGTSTSCPTNAFVSAGTICRASAGICDVADKCTGASASCPADTLAAAGTVCRAAAGSCDVAEACSGSSAACPTDGFLPSTTTCRASAGACDVAEKCTGAGAACPADGLAANGSPCNDGNACTQTDTCQSGTCTGANPVTCTVFDQCHGVGTCNPTDGTCSKPLLANGTSCNDGNACTRTDTCQSGTCTGANSVTCTAQDQCHATGSCDPSTGACSNPSVADGTACDDGNACTQADSCHGGVCNSGGNVTCVAQDDCHQAGACDGASGTCSNPPAPDGVPCGSGGQCLAGACQAGSGTAGSALNPTVPTDVLQAAAFLYQGAGARQTGVAPGIFDRARIGVIRGRVLSNAGAGISGVSVTTFNGVDYGATVTDADGTYSFVVNGADQYRLLYTLTGYLPVQRTEWVRPQDYSWFPDVVLTAVDPASTSVDLAAGSVTTAIASMSADASGSRQSILMFMPGTEATVVHADGTTQPVANMTVHSTEYTVGPSGPNAMPANLPATSGYTYALEFSVDEVDQTSGDQIQFNQPVVHYVDNFLHFPVGTPVPVGVLHESEGSWCAAPNGIVVKVLDVSSGAAELDVNGDEVADDADALAALGITDQELATLATLYMPGDSLWRVPLAHFSAYDFNWGVQLPTDAQSPADTVTADPDDTRKKTVTKCKGTSVECQDQILGESVPIVGTPFSLEYASDRVPGRTLASGSTIRLSGGRSLPASLKRIEFTAEIAGQQFHETFAPAPNLTTHFQWNGLDAFGRQPVGPQRATFTVGYVYDGIYDQPTTHLNAFGVPTDFPDQPIEGDRARGELTPLAQSHVQLERPNAADQYGVGGWTLNVLQSYSAVAGRLRTGDDTLISADPLGGRQSMNMVHLADPAHSPWRFATAPDGTVYMSNFASAVFNIVGRIVKLTPAGQLQTVAENITPTSVALRGDRVLFSSQTYTGLTTSPGLILSLGPDGEMTTIAGSTDPSCEPDGDGNRSPYYSGDGGPATDACLENIRDLKVGPDGSIYVLANPITSSSNVTDSDKWAIRRIDACGNIYPFAKGDFSNSASTPDQFWPYEMAIAPDGSIYVTTEAGGQGYQLDIRRLLPSGQVVIVAGAGADGTSCSVNPAPGRICPINPVVTPDGRVLFIDQQAVESGGRVLHEGVIASVEPDGTIGRPYTDLGVNIDRFDLMPSGDVTIDTSSPVDYSSNKLYRLRRPLPEISGSGVAVPAPGASEIYT